MKQPTDDQISELKETFSMFDKNNDGFISAIELKTVLEALGQHPTEKELEMMFDSVDTDNNGVIDFEEFKTLMISYLSYEEGEEKVVDFSGEIGKVSENELKEAFRVFDTDGDGFISEAELRQAMFNLGEKLTNEELKLMIKSADKDNNGKIDYSEFIEMMKTIS